MSRSTLFWQGARDSVPLLIAAAPFGILYGALAIDAGLSPWLAQGMSLLVFAGSAQFIAATLFAAATLWPVIVLTVFVVNLRHMLYAASLMPVVAPLGQGWRLPMAFWLTDETFAVVSNKLSRHPEEAEIRYYYLGSALAMYSLWQLETAIGIIAGQQIPDMTNWGLDVAMVVAFVGIVVPNLRTPSKISCALTSAVSILLTWDWPHQTGLLFSSMISITVGVLIHLRHHRSNEKPEEARG